MSFSDSALNAYLDGSLDEATCQSIEQALESDDALAERLMALDPLAKALPSAFAGLPSLERTEALQDHLYASRDAVTVAKWWQRPLATASAAACAAGLFGVIAGSLVFADLQSTARPDGVEDWHAQVAAYQALYVPQTVASIAATSQGLAEQFQAAQEAIGLDLQRERLADLENLDLRRAQILGYQGTPLVQVAFVGPDGAPWAFCVLPRQRGQAQNSQAQNSGTQSDGRTPIITELEGLASASWQSDSHGFMLIGGQDQSAIEDVATQLMGAFSL